MCYKNFASSFCTFLVRAESSSNIRTEWDWTKLRNNASFVCVPLMCGYQSCVNLSVATTVLQVFTDGKVGRSCSATVVPMSKSCLERPPACLVNLTKTGTHQTTLVFSDRYICLIAVQPVSPYWSIITPRQHSLRGRFVNGPLLTQKYLRYLLMFCLTLVGYFKSEDFYLLW